MIKDKNAVVYFGNLDGLRAIAAFLVICYHITLHLNFPHSKPGDHLLSIFSYNGLGGGIGVTFFFTLSGFLITYLMYVEREKTGDFGILSFYMRRVLRIWPLYYLTLIIGFIFFPLMMSWLGESYELNLDKWLYILFLTNFDAINNFKTVPGPLGVQWSVAIEEQFYLLWPLVFSLFNKKYFPLVLIVLTVGSSLYFALPNDWRIKYYHTFANIRYLSAGAFLAAIAYQYPLRLKHYLAIIPATAKAFIYFSGLLLIFFTPDIISIFPFYSYLIPLISLGFFLFIIAEQTFAEKKLFNLGSSKIITRMGKISYGLYLIHMIVITAVTALFFKSSDWIFSQVALVLFFTILLSELSYRFWESPFLKLKDQYAAIKTHN